MLVRALLGFAVGCGAAHGLHPRPKYKDHASYARWLVHESDYAVISWHHGGIEVFGNSMSISDGSGTEDSTGVIYTYLPDLDATPADLVADDRATMTFTETALEGGHSGGCQNSTAKNPPCGRLTISGRLTRVPPEQEANALKYLDARHPMMADWGKQHHFKPFWMAPENITDLFLINFFGGANHPTVKNYLAAPWFRNDTTGHFICSVCGHVYDPVSDGQGKQFEDLPDDWKCPVCGSPKSAYKKSLAEDGRAMWVHEHPEMVQFRNDTAGHLTCLECGHVYDPVSDGQGKQFEDLPDDWKCPVCGSPKSAYTKSLAEDGRAMWVHERPEMVHI